MSSAIPIKAKSSSSSNNQPSSPTSFSPSPSTSSSPFAGHRRRQSLLSSSLSKQEHTVFDLGIRDGTARLVTCVKAAQGFDWNQEMFLPHHMHSDNNISIPALTDRVDAVHEIILDDEDDGFLKEDEEMEGVENKKKR